MVDGQPLSHVTTAWLAWRCPRRAVERTRVLVRRWDQAAWHLSRQVRPWGRAQNQPVKHHGGLRLFMGRLPLKRPGLNPLESPWVHGTRAIVEPAGRLSATEIIPRVWAYFGSAHAEHLTSRVA